MYANIKECEAAGVDPTDVERIARGIGRYAKEAKALGITIFGGTGSGTLRKPDCRDKGALILAHIPGPCFDGGDGAEQDYGDDLLRGE